MKGSPESETRFRRLYAEHEDAMRLYCIRRLNPADVEDALADIFLVAWRRLDDLPPDDRVRLYLYGVARNVVYDHHRSARRRARLNHRARAVDAAPPPGPEAQVVIRHEERMVLEALGTMSEADQELLRLRAWEDLSRHDIAAILGISAPAVDMRLNRATKRLARALRRAGFGPELSIGPHAAQEGGVR